jgi:hypothetical protein
MDLCCLQALETIDLKLLAPWRKQTFVQFDVEPGLYRCVRPAEPTEGRSRSTQRELDGVGITTGQHLVNGALVGICCGTHSDVLRHRPGHQIVLKHSHPGRVDQHATILSNRMSALYNSKSVQ